MTAAHTKKNDHIFNADLFFFPFVRIGRRSTCAASLPSSSFFPPTVSCFADGRCGAPLSVFCLVVLYGASTLAFSFSLLLLCASVSSLHFCSTAQACLFFFFLLFQTRCIVLPTTGVLTAFTRVGTTRGRALAQ